MQNWSSKIELKGKCGWSIVSGEWVSAHKNLTKNRRYYFFGKPKMKKTRLLIVDLQEYDLRFDKVDHATRMKIFHCYKDELITIRISWQHMHRNFHTFICVMSMQTPPLGDKVWPSIEVAPP